MLKSKPPDAEVEARCRSRRVLLVENFAVKAQRKNPAANGSAKIAKKLSAESLAKRLRGQGSAKKPRKKAPRQRLREKARGEGSAKTEGSRKTEGSAKAPQNLRGKVSEGSAKNFSVTFDEMLSMLRKLV